MADNGFIMNVFRAMGANVTSDAEYEVPVSGDMTIKGDTFVSYHPNIPEGNMTKVIVPDGIKVIGKKAFMGPNNSHNYYLECCRLPEGVEVIKKEAFALCASMNEIQLPSTLKKIESEVFMYSGLRRINLPEGLETIGDGAFQNCRSISELRIPSTVTKIGSYCFSQMGVPLMDRDAPGAKIIAPSYLKDIYDKDSLNELFEGHEVEWYKAKKPEKESKEMLADYCCTFTVTGDRNFEISMLEDSKVNVPILIYQLGGALSLLDDLEVNRNVIASSLIEDYDEGLNSDLCTLENENSTFALTVYINSEDKMCVCNIDECTNCSGNEIFVLIYVCVGMLKSVKVSDDVIKALIALYFQSEDYDDFVSNLSDIVDEALELGPTDKAGKKSTDNTHNYPKTFSIRGNKLIKYTGKGYSVDVPDCVEIIGESAFEGNNNYHDIRIRDGVKRIESRSLAGLTEWNEVYIAQSVEYIADDAFGEKKTVRIGSYQRDDNPTVFAVKGSYAFERATALGMKVKECKPISVAKKRKIAPAEKKKLKNTEEISDVSRNYFSKFTVVNVPAARKKLLDKYAPRLSEENLLGCDLKIEHLNPDSDKVKVSNNVLARCGFMEFINKAKVFAGVFKTEDDEFNPKSDRFSEIYAGYIKHILVMHEFKSFTQVIYDYCHKVKKDFTDLNIEEMQAMADFIDEQGGTNFKEISNRSSERWMWSIRIRDEVDYEYSDNMCERTEKFYRLAFDLNELEPLMERIHQSLAEKKDNGIPVTGTLSDILLAWCTLSIALLKGGFKVASGLKDYDLTVPDDETLPYKPDYTVDDNGCVVSNGWIIGYEGNSKELKIDSRYKGNTPIRRSLKGEYNPKNVFISPFSMLEKIEFTEIPDKISNFNIDGEKIKSVKYCNGIKVLGKGAMEYCPELEEIILPDDLEKLSYGALPIYFYLNNQVSLVLPNSLKEIEGIYSTDKFKYFAYRDSYAANYLTEKNIAFTTLLTQEQIEADKRAEEEKKRQIEIEKQREAERLRKEAEERERLRKEAEAKRKAEEEARRKAEEERKAEEARIAAERKTQFEKLKAEKEILLQTIAENKGLFGEKARRRKEAKSKLAEVEEKMNKYLELIMGK